jgi:6-phosphogluconate dehydrogenase
LNKKVIFVLGVSGSGKTSVGRLLASKLSIPFIDADDHHPASNIKKMSQGHPLTDTDRYPWLDRLHEIAEEHIESGCVIACSALKQEYRNRLEKNIESSVSWVYLKGGFQQIYKRLENREGHFMSAGMLQSQFDTLEEPEDAINIDIADSPEIITKNIIAELKMKAEIGVIGMGVMGKSLSRNLANNGFRISLYNRHVDQKEENIAADFKAKHAELEDALAFDNLSSFVQSIEQPRKIILMVNAGAAVDAVISDLTEVLDSGDIVVDGGNSHFMDTKRRIDSMMEKELHFIGSGISGGEEGALKGPSIMPSGNQEAYAKIQNYLEAIAAKDGDNKPCCTYVGREGSGHFVKMIHNGIEYAEMQLLAECYSILKNQKLSNEEIADVFENWMKDLGSYLLGITVDILRKKDGDDYILDLILDKAGNKGTGKWATSSIADSGEPATMIPAALFARYISFFKEKRGAAAKVFPTPDNDTQISVSQLKDAYQFSIIINHHQGFATINRVSEQNNWNVDLSGVARIWTAGCIIKSDFMKELVGYLKTDSSILFNDNISPTIKKTYSAAQEVAIACLKKELHVPCLLEAVNFYHGIKTADCSANLIQAQRDYFGAHTYKRKDNPEGESHHTEWV